jgi:hypothetical protein
MTWLARLLAWFSLEDSVFDCLRRQINGTMTTTTLLLPPFIARLPQLRQIVRGGLAARGAVSAGLAVKAGGAAAAPWWQVAGKTCVMACRPQGAASLAASYVNEVTPGTHDAFLGTAPTWTKAKGWIGGSNAYLKTDVIPGENASILVQFSDGNMDTYVFGDYNGTANHLIIPSWSGGGVLYYHGGYKTKLPRMTAGVLAMCGATAYRNGVIDETEIGTWSGTGVPTFILAASNAGSAVQFFGGAVQAFAVWSDTLTGAEQLQVYNNLLAARPTRTAYVRTTGNDGTGVIDNAAQPYLTINAALDAVGYGRAVIDIGAGTFGPITGDLVASTSKLFDYLVLRGAGQPTVKSDHTGLETGTIIQGPLVFDRSNVELYDLGVDSGSAVCTALYGGTAQDALAFCANVGQVVGKPARTGLIAKRITTICKAYDSAVHAFACENASGAVLEDITTCYGSHGVVLKAINTTAMRLTAIGHQANGLIVKANTYAPCHDVTISDVTIGVVTAGQGGGVYFHNEAAGADLADVTVDDVTITGTSYGVHYNGDTNYVRRANVTNLTGETGVNKAGNVADCYVNGTPV